MTDRGTIAPPPDRDRDTDRPTGDEAVTPTIPELRISEQVALRLDVFDQNLQALREEIARLDKLDELHELLTEVRIDPDEDRKVTVLDVLLGMNEQLTEIKANSEAVLAHHREYADEVSRVYAENVSIKEQLAEHAAKLSKIGNALPQVPFF